MYVCMYVRMYICTMCDYRYLYLYKSNHKKKSGRESEKKNEKKKKIFDQTVSEWLAGLRKMDEQKLLDQWKKREKKNITVK